MAPDGQDRSTGPPVPHDRHSREGHLILTYRGEEPPWRPVFSFLTTGAAANGRLLYVYDRTDPKDVQLRLREARLDVDSLLSSGQLRFQSAEEHYLTDGTFEPARIIERGRRALEETRRDGFDGLHVVGETGCTAALDIPVESIVEYERRVGELLSQTPIEALCLYPADRFDDPVLDTLTEVHDEFLRTRGNGPALDGGSPPASAAERIARETTFRALPVALLHVRWPEGLIQACNDAAVSYTGYGRADLVGSVLERLFPEQEDADDFRRRCAEVLDRDRSRGISFPIRRADGEPLPTRHEVVALDAPSGEPRSALLAMREATGE